MRDNTKYLAWIDAVFNGVADQLGGDDTQTGSDRTFGDARFSHSTDGMGDVTFRVLLLDHPLRPARLCGSFEWRAYPDPLVVTRQLIAVYHELKSM